MDLDGIWDEPAEIASSSSAEPLFLPDEDDIEVDPASPRKSFVPRTDIDIDAIFADVDKEDDDLDDMDAAPDSSKPYNMEAAKRKAAAKYKNAKLPGLTPHQILPSSSPPRDFGDADTGKGKGKGKDDKDDGEKKERKKPMRLDDGRLIGPTGFPQLIKDTKNFRIKGKGHEETDLKRLLQVYQFWSHRMYPKTQFRDTVERVEKLCHSRRMASMLSVWRDEAMGKKPKDVDEDSDNDSAIIDLTENDNIPIPKSAPGSDAADYASSSSRAPTNPPSSPGTTGSDGGKNHENDFDFDLDEVIKEAEQQQKGGSSAAASSASKGHAPPAQPTQMDVDLDDEDMWNAFDSYQDSSTVSAFSGPPPPTATANVDDDEDMWDIIKEMEEEEAAKKGSAGSTKPPSTIAPPSPVPPSATLDTGIPQTPPQNPTVEEDWEDIYQ